LFPPHSSKEKLKRGIHERTYQSDRTENRYSAKTKPARLQGGSSTGENLKEGLGGIFNKAS
jgi:hypothetical protein